MSRSVRDEQAAGLRRFIQEHQVVGVVGEPGIGKSTCLTRAVSTTPHVIGQSLPSLATIAYAPVRRVRRRHWSRQSPEMPSLAAWAPAGGWLVGRLRLLGGVPVAWSASVSAMAPPSPRPTKWSERRQFDEGSCSDRVGCISFLPVNSPLSTRTTSWPLLSDASTSEPKPSGVSMNRS